jgi:sugar phosphate isomerase/epimerase
MNLGIFAKTFSRPSLEAVLDAIVSHDLRHVQFNLLCAGLPTLPDALSEDQAQQIRRAFESRNLVMAAISGTFNMIHPEVALRRENLHRLGVLAAACGALGVSVITLCTGTRDPRDMWRRHPENSSPAAWNDLLRSMETALEIAERHQITLAVETEINNVVDYAGRARALLDHFRSPFLKIIMDPANLFGVGDLARVKEILNEAFDLLGRDTVLAHAKDLSSDGDAGREAAGTGLLDYDYYLELLQRIHFTGPLILHSLCEDQVPASINFLRSKLRKFEPIPHSHPDSPSPSGGQAGRGASS